MKGHAWAARITGWEGRAYCKQPLEDRKCRLQERGPRFLLIAGGQKRFQHHHLFYFSPLLQNGSAFLGLGGGEGGGELANSVAIFECTRKEFAVVTALTVALVVSRSKAGFAMFTCL